MKKPKKSVRKGEWRPGKEKAPRPRPAPAPTKRSGDEEAPARPEERETDDKVIAPDGEPEPKENRTPLF